ncbi:MAG: T9SS type A sorting domain-containing protein, partial [Cyanobacteria bacterium REEB459]|nr:T9SS type A sorting domain-containing protein [Cyanobacteria bacterium REEB459]
MNSLFSTDLALTPSNFVAGGNLFETVLESAQRQLQLSLSPSQGLGMADLGSHFRAKTGVDPSLTLFPGLDLSQGLSQTAVSRFAEEVNIFMPLRRSLSDFDALIGGLASRAAVDALLDPKRPSAARSESSDSSMALLAAPVDNAGNTLATARNIGTLSSSQSFSDFVGSTDTNDYYLFTLSQTSNFSLTLNGLSADADVQLLNGSGNVLTISNRTGTQAESISQSLNAGTYYVRVFPFSTANTNY